MIIGGYTEANLTVIREVKKLFLKYLCNKETITIEYPYNKFTHTMEAKLKVFEIHHLFNLII